MRYYFALLLVIILVTGFIGLFGGFTAYEKYAVLSFEERSPGEYYQVPDPNYPTELVRHFRLPWEQKYIEYYILPPMEEDGG